MEREEGVQLTVPAREDAPGTEAAPEPAAASASASASAPAPGRSRKRAIAAVVVLVVVLVAAMAGYRVLAGNPAGTGMGAEPAATGEASFAADADILQYDSEVLGLEDTRYTLSQLAAGKPLVINFWATWCPYCLDEMPDFQAFYEEYGDRVSFVMLDATGSNNETVEKATAYIYENEFTFPVYFDAWQNASYDYGVYSLPTTVLYSASGELLAIQPGRVDPDGFRENLEQLIAWE